MKRFGSGAIAAIAVGVLIAMTIGLGGGTRVGTAAEETMKDGGLSYTESTAVLMNPDRGFYHAIEGYVPASGREPVWTERKLTELAQGYGLLHLRFGLEAFSANAGGTDMPLTEDALASLEATFAILRKLDANAVVRFSYNVKGIDADEEDDYPYRNSEPSMELVEQHVAQLGTVLEKYRDTIACIETGMLGPWGEQHSTILASEGDVETTFYRLIEAWLAATSERALLVRRPRYVRFWANERYGLMLDEDNVASDARALALFSDPEEDAYRIGVFNDGYLGSSTDLGTFDNRAVEVEWLSLLTAHTPYGGEVAKQSGNPDSDPIGDYNNCAYMTEESASTHTAYLNQGWNNYVTGKWAATPYSGPDPVWNKSGKSEFDYLDAHMGYRYVLRGSLLSASASQGGQLRLCGSIENVGFGNVYNKKIARVLLVPANGGTNYACETDFDLARVTAGTERDYDMTFRLPSAIPAGDYTVFLKIRDAQEVSDGTVRCIKFANDGVYDARVGGNKLGSVSVARSAHPGDYDAFEQIAGETPEPVWATFDANGGEGAVPDEIGAQPGETIRLPKCTLTKVGHRFDGWELGGKLYPAGATYVLSSSAIFTAHWAKETYTVTFDGNGGNLVSGSERQTVPYGEAAVPPVYRREGYTFGGWDADIDSVTGDLNVKAQWRGKTYVVRFLSLEPATLVEGEAEQEVEEGGSATPPVYEREGYRLAGWRGSYTNVDSDVIVYAVWEQIAPADEGEESGGLFGGCGGTIAGVGGLSVLLAAGVLAARKRR